MSVIRPAGAGRGKGKWRSSDCPGRQQGCCPEKGEGNQQQIRGLAVWSQKDGGHWNQSWDSTHAILYPRGCALKKPITGAKRRPLGLKTNNRMCFYNFLPLKNGCQGVRHSALVPPSGRAPQVQKGAPFHVDPARHWVTTEALPLSTLHAP